MPVLKWMQSSGLGGPRIGGLRILILVLPINHWDIAKSLAAVDKKKKSLELLGYTALYIFIHKQELPVLLEFFFWVTDFGLYLGFESYECRAYIDHASIPIDTSFFCYKDSVLLCPDKPSV